MALRPTDPALLHYRSGGFYCARAAQVSGVDAVRDVLLGLTASRHEPISGGRHKVFGNPALHVIPQTSTIASHLPRAVGLAFALHRAKRLGVATPWPEDAVVVTSLGDASINHSTAVGALNAAGHAVHTRLPLPLLVVCEDNGWGISVPSAPGWVEAALSSRPGFTYAAADGADPVATLEAATSAVEQVRSTRRPAILHLRTVRFLGHAGSDAELGYRRPRDVEADLARDPLLGTAHALVAAGMPPARGARSLRRGSRPGVANGGRGAARRAPHVGRGGDVAARAGDPHRPCRRRRRPQGVVPARPARGRRPAHAGAVVERRAHRHPGHLPAGGRAG